MIYDLLIAVTTDNLKDGGEKHVDFFTVKGKYVSAGEQGHQVERKEVLRSKRDRCCHGSEEKKKPRCSRCLQKSPPGAAGEAGRLADADTQGEKDFLQMGGA